MVDIAVDRTVDPDAQAAVTDFLDYTEYLPSDLIRSLTLIRGLDETYHEHADSLHELTKLYGSIPSVEPSMRPDPTSLRLQIISTLDSALTARESSYAEASRLFDVVDRHQNRLKSIIAKLNAIPKPPSRDPTPQPPTSNKKHSKSGREIKPAPTTTRLTLNPPRSGAVASAILGRPRGRRVTVPGEVLPPYDPDEAIASTEVSDWESPPSSPPRPLLKLKQPKPPKEKDESTPAERIPRAYREQSNYKKPTPPPEDAEMGSRWKPWTRLTEYEMYKLRKKMKKNHTWDPSPVMIKRELELRGRGWENYYRAKAEAQKNGRPFLDIEHANIPGQSSTSHQAKADSEESEPSSPIVVAAPEPKVKPKKIEAKKEKKGEPVRSQAAIAAQEAELAARRLGDIGSAFKNLFSPLSNALASLNRSASTPSATTTAKKSEKTAKKRKLEEMGVSASPSIEPDQRKKQKISASKTSPLPALSSMETPQPSAGTIKIPLKLTVPAVEPSTTTETSSSASSSRETSEAESIVAPKTEEATPPPTVRPVSRKSTAPPADGTEGLPSSTTRATSRIASVPPATATGQTPSISLRVTPAVESSPRGIPTAASRRPKREVPGTVTQSSQDGGAAVSISKRKTKPGKQKKISVAAETPAEVRVDVDGRAEVVDPDEERYCICGDVSYGEMICCELDEKVCYSGFLTSFLD